MTESAVKRFIVSGVVPAAAHLAPLAVTLHKAGTVCAAAPSTPAPDTARAMDASGLPPRLLETTGQPRMRTTAGSAR